MFSSFWSQNNNKETEAAEVKEKAACLYKQAEEARQLATRLEKQTQDAHSEAARLYNSAIALESNNPILAAKCRSGK